MDKTYTLSNQTMKEVRDILASAILAEPCMYFLHEVTRTQLNTLSGAIMCESLEVQLDIRPIRTRQGIGPDQVEVLNQLFDTAEASLTERGLMFVEDFINANIELPDWL